MKITIGQVFKILDIYKSVKELKAPAKVAYKFNKLCTSLDNDVKFYNEELNKIIQQYGEKEDDGSFKRTQTGDIKIQSDFIVTAQKEVYALWDLEVDVPDITFTVDELDGLQLSIENFNAMLPFIVEE